MQSIAFAAAFVSRSLVRIAGKVNSLEAMLLF
jgi:uncharacterized membrane protein